MISRELFIMDKNKVTKYLLAELNLVKISLKK